MSKRTIHGEIFRWPCLLATIGILMAWSLMAADDHMVLIVDQVPKDGLVVARVDLTEAARACKTIVEPARLRAFSETGEQAVLAQFVPEEGNPSAGTMVLRCDPASAQARLRLDFNGVPSAKPSPSATVRTRWYTVTHDAQRMGGLPAELVFAGDGQKSEAVYWGDRLYHRQAGPFALRYDRQARAQVVSSGPLCTVVRTAAHHAQPDGRYPASQPSAVYEWYYFHDQPLVHVRCVARQLQPALWHEAHFLEFGFRTNGFTRWVGGEPVKEDAFRGGDQSFRFHRWGAVFAASNGMAMLDAGVVGIYDGKGYGRYMHARMDEAWREWETTEFTRSAWLWIGTADKPAQILTGLAAARTGHPTIAVSTESLRRRIEQLDGKLAKGGEPARGALGWQLAVTRLLEQQGRFREALAADAASLPKAWSVINAGDLRLVLERRSNGIELVNLLDAGKGALLAGAERLPLFELSLRESMTNEVRLAADHGWGEVEIEARPRENAYALHWRKPLDARLGDLSVTVIVRPDAVRRRLAWSLEAQGEAKPWALWQVGFPQISLAAAGTNAQLLLPQAAGVLKPVGREAMAPFQGDYPSGWMAMQLAALYDETAGTGLYFGLHDPVGSTKRFTADSSGEARVARLAWTIPVPDMGRPGNRFVLSGEGVWQLLRGDWFDAALIYRDWARREAKWYPPLTADGRGDTPLWMRELCAWTISNGLAKECVPRVREFARALGAPVGFHWYNWHQIPFDNDYPHYFPARDGFVEGVKELQSEGVSVMPYINGRLWDTHDRGTNDFEFTRLARPAATKNAKGEPWIESYGSKEANGQLVNLAVMCPATQFWRERQHDIVLRLFNEGGVKGVYMDQTAAAKPEWCFDASHGHPLGGGSWWNEQGYWPMLEQIRRDKPADRMLTTECNAEPFLRWFDGYLTWHWQYDGQVPLFPAVYGGAIQMFGRAYRSGPTKDLALRMKAGQQLVWGEQLGWLDPGLVREPENLAFFRDAVQLRLGLRCYFYAGQMARPPRLAGDIPNVTADWQWSGVWPVTTAAVMAGAWQLPGEKRLVLLFANVSGQPVTATVHYGLREAGLAGAVFARRQRTAQGESALTDTSATIRESVVFPPRSVRAWEISGKK